jgi:hypothetical protein
MYKVLILINLVIGYNKIEKYIILWIELSINDN